MSKFSKEDESLLKSRIHSNEIHYSRAQVVIYALLMGSQSIHFGIATRRFTWQALPVVAQVILAVAALMTAYILFRAYVVMVETAFWRRQKHFEEVKSDDSAKLRAARTDRAVYYSLFCINLFFSLGNIVGLVVLHQLEATARHIIVPLLVAAFVWLVVVKNEESRKKKLRRGK